MAEFSVSWFVGADVPLLIAHGLLVMSCDSWIQTSLSTTRAVQIYTRHGRVLLNSGELGQTQDTSLQSHKLISIDIKRRRLNQWPYGCNLLIIGLKVLLSPLINIQGFVVNFSLFKNLYFQFVSQQKMNNKLSVKFFQWLGADSSQLQVPTPSGLLLIISFWFTIEYSLEKLLYLYSSPEQDLIPHS